MVYNKASEEKKWKKWKQKEEQILKENGMTDDKILELRRYDWRDFNAERRFKKWQLTNYNFINQVPFTELKLPIRDMSDVIDQIEDENLYQVMIKAHIQDLVILYLKMYGYKNKEIASIMNISESIVRKRLSNIRKKLK
ncbi:LuxR C-terminal-related transcriptional regulator [Allocoprobacillus halotolerans]|uniref:LuxR C-terminal-related transcriptional regulator n=1 Tax=Allocoprobacillus halotolerans TaxID=2944914 RepID=A0ABY5I114_9FIRM|nr:sigma factor-like helix-turn-helix DNA-binding protein [Allocoprobacillus halotolerans]UTY39053.1 LuxR C-terminal-related transcriptional regulator [Allocoprobacillus halotolerans]